MLSGNGAAWGSPGTAAPRAVVLPDGGRLLEATLLTATLLAAALLLTGAALAEAAEPAAVATVLLIPLTDGVPPTLAQAVNAAAMTTAPARLTATLPRRTPRLPTLGPPTLRPPTRCPITQLPLSL